MISGEYRAESEINAPQEIKDVFESTVVDARPVATADAGTSAMEGGDTPVISDITESN